MDFSAQNHPSPSSGNLGEYIRALSELPNFKLDSKVGREATQVDGNYLLKMIFKNSFPCYPIVLETSFLEGFPEAS